MAAPAINLNTGYVLVQQATSSLGITSLDNDYLFGTIAKIYPTCGNFVVGNSVMFNSKTATRILFGSTIYFQVHETFLTGNEGTPA